MSISDIRRRVSDFFDIYEKDNRRAVIAVCRNRISKEEQKCIFELFTNEGYSILSITKETVNDEKMREKIERMLVYAQSYATGGPVADDLPTSPIVVVVELTLTDILFVKNANSFRGLYARNKDYLAPVYLT